MLLLIQFFRFCFRFSLFHVGECEDAPVLLRVPSAFPRQFFPVLARAAFCHVIHSFVMCIYYVAVNAVLPVIIVRLRVGCNQNRGKYVRFVHSNPPFLNRMVQTGGGIQVKKATATRVENQVYSNRVLRSEFDRNWRTILSRTGYVIYIATANRAKVVVLLSSGARKLLVFNKGGRVLVGGGGTSHYSKPHVAKDL